MGRPIKKGSTDQSTVIRILDSTNFTPENSVEYDTAGIALWYRREQSAKVAITPAALASLTAAHTDGGIELIADGSYRLDLPDDAGAVGSGKDSVHVGGTLTDMIVIGNEHALVDYDPYDVASLGVTVLADWVNGGRLDLLLDAIPTTAMRGTDDAALASVLGALDNVAAAGEVTEADTLMQYIKQLINILIGTPGVGTFPAEAAPGNGVSIAEVMRAIHADVTGLNGDVMRGTNSANTTKTGYSLASDGVDSVICNVATVGATPTLLLNKIQAIWNRSHTKKTVTASLETAYEVNDSTVMETWDLADDDTTASRTR